MGGIVKPLLRDQAGRTVLETIEATLGPDLARAMVVAPGALAPLLRTHTASAIVEDSGAGPGAALIAAARLAETTWLLLVGGDQPRPSLALLRRLLALAGDEVDAVAVMLESKRQPLWALYRARAVRAAFAAEPEPPRSLQSILDRLKPRIIDGAALEPDQAAAFVDVDTIERARELGLSTEGVPSLDG
jgi:molybdopterin-guanine dinucleotide biosynthesis protein A